MGCHEYLSDPFAHSGELDVPDFKKIVRKVSTVWMAPHRLDRDGWRNYLDWLVEHRFHGTVYSLSPSVGSASGNQVGRPSFGSLTSPGAQLFDEVDWMISEAASKGIKTHLLAFWANPFLARVSGDDLFTYCKWLGERYGKVSDVEAMIIGGDWLDNTDRGTEIENYPKYDRMLEGFSEAAIDQKIYHHNGSGCGHLADRELLDGWYTQFGHGWVVDNPHTTHIKLIDTWEKNKDKECHVGEAGYPNLFFEEMPRPVSGEDVITSMRATLQWYRDHYRKEGPIYHVNGFSEHWQVWTAEARDMGIPKYFTLPDDQKTFEESLENVVYSETEHALSDLIDEHNAQYLLEG